MPAQQLHFGENPLAMAPATGVELKHVVALSEKKGSVVTVANAEEVEVLLQDGIFGSEVGGPREGNGLVQASPMEVIKGERDQKKDEYDLEDVRAEGGQEPKGRGRGGFKGRRGGGGVRFILGECAWLLGVNDKGDSLKLVLIPDHGGGGERWIGGRGMVGVRRIGAGKGGSSERSGSGQDNDVFGDVEVGIVRIEALEVGGGVGVGKKDRK